MQITRPWSALPVLGTTHSTQPQLEMCHRAWGVEIQLVRQFPGAYVRQIMMSTSQWIGAFAAAWICLGARAAEASPPPAWGRITAVTNPPGTLRLEVAKWPADGRLSIPTPALDVISANLLNDTRRRPINWVFNADATRLELRVPTNPPAILPAQIELETIETTGQFADGRIVFKFLSVVI